MLTKPEKKIITMKIAGFYIYPTQRAVPSVSIYCSRPAQWGGKRTDLRNFEISNTKGFFTYMKSTTNHHRNCNGVPEAVCQVRPMRKRAKNIILALQSPFPRR